MILIAKQNVVYCESIAVIRKEVQRYLIEVISQQSYFPDLGRINNIQLNFWKLRYGPQTQGNIIKNFVNTLSAEELIQFVENTSMKNKADNLIIRFFNYAFGFQNTLVTTIGFISIPEFLVFDLTLDLVNT